MEATNTSIAKTTPSNPPPNVNQSATPSVDITESDSGITLLADLPGVSKDRLTIKVEGDSLQIEGRAEIDVAENI